MKGIFREILAQDADDALTFDVDAITVEDITEFKEYHGLRISAAGYLDRTRIPISIDIGFGDVIYPDKVTMEFPTLLDMESPKIYAYSIYSAIAEKFEAIVSLGLVNSRYKDFYDIYAIAKSKSIDGKELQTAIMETFQHRNTDFNDIVAFTDEFMKDRINQTRWNSFIKKKQVNETVTFEEIIKHCKKLLEPIVDNIANHSSFEFIWDYSEEKWVERR